MNPIADAGAGSQLPSNQIERWHSGDGTPMTIRPIRPQDAPALKSMIEGLQPHDRHRRFHGTINGVSPRQLVNMVCVDQQHQLALVVTARLPCGEPVVADARYVVNHRGDCAEFAIVVASGWQRRGIGSRAITALVQAASRGGLRWLRGSVQPDNAPMLALMRACGFACTQSPDDRSLVSAETHVPTCNAAPANDMRAAWRGRSDSWTQFW